MHTQLLWLQNDKEKTTNTNSPSPFLGPPSQVFWILQTHIVRHSSRRNVNAFSGCRSLARTQHHYWPLLPNTRQRYAYIYSFNMKQKIHWVFILTMGHLCKCTSWGKQETCNIRWSVREILKCQNLLMWRLQSRFVMWGCLVCILMALMTLLFHCLCFVPFSPCLCFVTIHEHIGHFGLKSFLQL